MPDITKCDFCGKTDRTGLMHAVKVPGPDEVLTEIIVHAECLLREGWTREIDDDGHGYWKNNAAPLVCANGHHGDEVPCVMVEAE